MKPAGVHHVAICVADAQKGLIFYRDVARPGTGGARVKQACMDNQLRLRGSAG